MHHTRWHQNSRAARASGSTCNLPTTVWDKDGKKPDNHQREKEDTHPHCRPAARTQIRKKAPALSTQRRQATCRLPAPTPNLDGNTLGQEGSPRPRSHRDASILSSRTADPATLPLPSLLLPWPSHHLQGALTSSPPYSQPSFTPSYSHPDPGTTPRDPWPPALPPSFLLPSWPRHHVYGALTSSLPSVPPPHSLVQPWL